MDTHRLFKTEHIFFQQTAGDGALWFSSKCQNLNEKEINAREAAIINDNLQNLAVHWFAIFP